MADMEKEQVHLIKPDLGLSDSSIQKTVEVLQTILADELVLYMKLRNFHWNVTGPNFIQFHELFEEQYTELAETIDEVAERVRMVGAQALGTYKEALELTRLHETSNLLTAREMVAELVADHEAMVRYAAAGVDAMDDVDNVGDEDFCTQLLQKHQKMAWLLRAHLEG